MKKLHEKIAEHFESEIAAMQTAVDKMNNEKIDGQRYYREMQSTLTTMGVYRRLKADMVRLVQAHEIEQSGRDSDQDIAVAEHAFRAGFAAAEEALGAHGSDRLLEAVEQAWGEYTPPEELTGGGLR